MHVLQKKQFSMQWRFYHKEMCPSLSYLDTMLKLPIAGDLKVFIQEQASGKFEAQSYGTSMAESIWEGLLAIQSTGICHLRDKGRD